MKTFNDTIRAAQLSLRRGARSGSGLPRDLLISNRERVLGYSADILSSVDVLGLDYET